MVDIGGGSTEMIIGRGIEPLELESLKLGCVVMSARYFGDGKLSGKRFARARLAAQQELEPVQEAYLKRGWKQAAGSSGTRALDLRCAEGAGSARPPRSRPTASRRSSGR